MAYTDSASHPQEAGVPRKLAPTIGIPVDYRRQNTSQESLTLNVARLKAYKARLILFPRKAGQHKKLDSSAEEVATAEKAGVKHVAGVLPIESGVGLKHGFSELKKSDIPKGEEAAYRRLRDARSEARLIGVREKRAKAKAEEEMAKKK
jgi:large subunit ribosomal protein L13e